MVSLTGLFLLLEIYATHFVLIPYYIGLIHHRPDGTITSFYVSQGWGLGWEAILSRLAINKAFFISPSTFVLLWLGFAAANIGLFVLAWKCAVRHYGKT